MREFICIWNVCLCGCLCLSVRCIFDCVCMCVFHCGAKFGSAFVMTVIIYNRICWRLIVSCCFFSSTSIECGAWFLFAVYWIRRSYLIAIDVEVAEFWTSLSTHKLPQYTTWIHGLLVFCLYACWVRDACNSRWLIRMFAVITNFEMQMCWLFDSQFSTNSIDGYDSLVSINVNYINLIDKYRLEYVELSIASSRSHGADYDGLVANPKQPFTQNKHLYDGWFYSVSII